MPLRETLDERAVARARRELGGALLLLTVLLVTVVAAALITAHDLHRNAQRAYVQRAIPIRSAVQDLLLQEVNQETGVRGLLLTGRPESLRPYRDGHAAAVADLARLRTLAADDPELARHLPPVERAIDALDGYFTSEIAAAGSGSRRGRAAVDRGTELFDAFRAAAAPLVAEADALVKRTSDRERAHYRGALGILGVAGLAALGIAITLLSILPARAASVARRRWALLRTERASREMLERTIAAAPQLGAGEPAEVRTRVCALAREVFGSDAATLWDVGADEIELLHREPASEHYRPGARRAVAELPGLAEALRSATPLYVHDLQTVAAGQTRRSAQALRSGSLLNLPISVGGVARMMVGLVWSDRIPELSATERLAAQRFADQAGLALEQAQLRHAQREIASLNRTLQRMVQTDPLFKAGGTRDEVAEAVCAAALDIFEADAAALWTADPEAIELIHRLPGADTLPRRIRIPFAEHPTFRDDLDSGRPRFIADIERDEPALWRRYARGSRSRSQLRLPLASAGSARALIVLSWSRQVDAPSAQTDAVARRFADQAALALAEAERRLAARDAERLHARFEQSLLPTLDVRAPDVDVAAVYRPGDARLRLGGDFYDCLELPDGSVALLIGDVAGHGAAAAALGASMRSAWRALTLSGLPLGDLPAALQRVGERERPQRDVFVTALSGVVGPDRRRLRFISAGHPHPILLGGEPAPDGPHAPPLGVVDDGGWEVQEWALPARASVVAYTDGLVEGRSAQDPRRRFGVEPILAMLEERAAGAIGAGDLQELIDAATAAHGDGLPDDVALLALNVRRT